MLLQVQGYKYYAGTRLGVGGGVGGPETVIISCASQSLIPGMRAESPVDKLLPGGILSSVSVQIACCSDL